MYARITTIPVKPESLDGLTAVFGEAILPALQALPGFVDLLLVADPGSGKALSISLWESEAAWAESETSGVFQQQAAKLAGLLTEPPTREGYTLLLRT